MNVWYLHGLESAVGGPKVDFLKSVADRVFAPKMVYSNPNMFKTLLESAKIDKPDLIIGSIVFIGHYLKDSGILPYYYFLPIFCNPSVRQSISQTINRTKRPKHISCL